MANEETKRKERSPSYPSIPLSLAVERTRQLYRHEKGYPAPIETILGHWGYQAKSGGGLTTLAAVLRYGLIQDEGSANTRRARVSELGLGIVRDTRDVSPERDRLIRSAALNPAIYRELWSKYGGSLPSDSNLEHSLKTEYSFTDLGAREFLKAFRASIVFAKLDEAEPDEGHPQTIYPTAIESQGPVSAPAVVREARIVGGRVPLYGGGPAAIRLPLPIAAPMDRWPTLFLPVRLTEAEWQSMKALLDAMKGGIVESPASAAEKTEAEAAFDHMENSVT